MILEQFTKIEMFTPLEQEIIQYILKYKEEISYLSINTLASSTYSSNASIIRLCRKVGYHGFKDFKVKFLKELEASRQSEYLDMNRPFYQGDTSHQILNAMTSLYNQTILTVSHEIDIKQLETLAQSILKSQRILIFALGDSAIRANSFINKLYKINKYCILTTTFNEQRVLSQNSTQEDLALFITYRGHNHSFDQCLSILKKNKTPIYSITSHVDTNITRSSKISIQIPSRESTADNIATFYSQISFDFILNTLYSLIYTYNYAKNHQIKSRIDHNNAQ